MAINVSVQYNDGLLLDIILTVDPMLLPSGNPIKCHQEVLSLQSIIPPNKRFDIFSTGGCSEDLDAFRFSFKQDKRRVVIPREILGKACSCWTSMAPAKGRHIGRLWSMTLLASLRTVVCVFFFITCLINPTL